MSHVDSLYYTNTYKGDIPSEQLDTLLSRASDIVDQLTYFRIGELESLTAFQQEQVKKAVCSQADFLYETQGLPDEVQSYSINGVSVSFGQAGKGKYSSSAINYLKATGLLYGGW